MNDFTPAKLKLLADAELMPAPAALRRGASAAAQKSVLLAIAAHEGELISYTGLAVRSCLNRNVVRSCVLALVFYGIVVQKQTDYFRARQYRVSWERLAELATREDLYQRGGGTAVVTCPKKRAEHRLGAERARRRRIDARDRAAVEAAA